MSSTNPVSVERRQTIGPQTFRRLSTTAANMFSRQGSIDANADQNFYNRENKQKTQTSSGFTTHTVSPIKVQVTPAEPRASITGELTGSRNPEPIRVTRRQTDAAVNRKMTPPVISHGTYAIQLQPEAMDTVSAYPEAVRNVRPRPPSPIQEETTTDENSMTTNQTTSNVPPSHHRFRLPPLKIANTGQNGGDSAKPTVATLASPPKNMTSVGVPSKPRNTIVSDPRTNVSQYRVLLKCSFVVFFLSIPVIIFIIMMALSGGFAPFQTDLTNGTNYTISNSGNNETATPIGAST